jgi:formyltetrahydrofolate deformylase
MEHYILTLRCADQPGIVRSLAEGIVRVKGNILESAQFSDPPTGLFCLRTSFESPDENVEAVRERIAGEVARFEPALTLRRESSRRRMLVMVSRHDHCLRDLLYRWDVGEIPADLRLVVSNHEDCGYLAERYGVPYVRIPVSAATIWSKPRTSVPPPASRIPSRAMSDESSGGVSSSVSRIAWRISPRIGAIAARTSALDS